jgi:hypothetical protein
MCIFINIHKLSVTFVLQREIYIHTIVHFILRKTQLKNQDFAGSSANIVNQLDCPNTKLTHFSDLSHGHYNIFLLRLQDMN